MAITAACSIAGPVTAYASDRAPLHGPRHAHHWRTVSSARVLQCVAFARSASEIALTGNAANWWQNAQGVYARGTAPEVGSVLNFRANSRMRLGHVAVVTQVTDSRTIQIEQSHWHANGISRDVSVVDVSPNNDWSAVRVAVRHEDAYGSIYPTYGFIYPRPDSSGRIITAHRDAALPHTAITAPSTLRPEEQQVAEAPEAESGPLAVTGDAPDRNLR